MEVVCKCKLTRKLKTQPFRFLNEGGLELFKKYGLEIIIFDYHIQGHKSLDEKSAKQNYSV